MWQSETSATAPLACLACESRRGREETTMARCLLYGAHIRARFHFPSRSRAQRFFVMRFLWAARVTKDSCGRLVRNFRFNLAQDQTSGPFGIQSRLLLNLITWVP